MHRHDGREYDHANECPICWEDACNIIHDQLGKARAENVELRHALSDARAVIAEFVERLQPLLPFILSRRAYDEGELDRFERENAAIKEGAK